MANFRYKARDKASHKTVQGTVSAKNQGEAVKKLKTKNLLILSIQPDFILPFSIGKRVNARDRILFARELAVMIKAGLPILQALKSIEDQTSNRALKKAVSGLIQEVEGGTPLSDSFAHQPHIFPAIFVSAARTGEKSGKLEVVLERLATQLEKDDDIISKVRGAMIYPAFVLVALVAVIILIMVFIIPQLEDIFLESGAELPIITKTLLWISQITRQYILQLAIALVVLVVGVRYLSRIPVIGQNLERLAFLIPVFGPLKRKVLMTRFSRNLATLLNAGLPMIDAMATTAQALNSPTYSASLKAAAKEIENGKPLSETLLKDRHYPVMIGHMVAIGEASGKIDSVLETVSEFFDKEVENTTRNLSALLEPILMLIMGLGVGFVVASVIMPMYNLVDVL